MAKLGDIATYVNGFAFKPSDWSNEGLPIIRIQDLTGNSYQANRYNGSYHPKYEVNDGDVLISWSASLGVYVWKGEKAVLNQHIFKVVFDKSEVDKNFFVHQVQNILENAASEAHGATMKHLTKPVFDALPFYLPSIEKQKEIASVLDKATELIALRKEQLAKLDELVKARFVELFGNGHDGKTPVKMLGSICKFQQGTQIPVEEQFEEQIAGYKRFLRIIDYTQAPQPPRYVNVNGKEVDEKSVVIVRYGATAGFVGRGYQGILANNLFEIIPDETILSKEFLFLALKYGTFEKEVHDKAFGAAMPALSFSMMNDIPVVVPMSEQQSQFVSFVEQTDKSKLAVQQSLDRLELLKKALMQEYFG